MYINSKAFFEVFENDNDYSFKLSMAQCYLLYQQQKPILLKRVINHPKLFRKYPVLKYIHVIFGQITDSALDADSYTKFSEHIVNTKIFINLDFNYYHENETEKYPITGQYPELSKEANLLHELQHAVQYCVGKQLGRSHESILQEVSGRVDREGLYLSPEKIDYITKLTYKQQPQEQAAMKTVFLWLNHLGYKYNFSSDINWDYEKSKEQNSAQDGIYAHGGTTPTHMLTTLTRPALIRNTIVSVDAFNKLTPEKQTRVLELINEFNSLGYIDATLVLPDQWARSTAKGKKNISDTAVKVFGIEDEIKQLLKSDEQLSSEERDAEIKKLKGRQLQITNYLQLVKPMWRAYLENPRPNKYKKTVAENETELEQVNARLAELDGGEEFAEGGDITDNSEQVNELRNWVESKTNTKTTTSFKKTGSLRGYVTFRPKNKGGQWVDFPHDIVRQMRDEKPGQEPHPNFFTKSEIQIYIGNQVFNKPKNNCETCAVEIPANRHYCDSCKEKYAAEQFEKGKTEFLGYRIDLGRAKKMGEKGKVSGSGGWGYAPNYTDVWMLLTKTNLDNCPERRPFVELKNGEKITREEAYERAKQLNLDNKMAHGGLTNNNMNEKQYTLTHNNNAILLTTFIRKVDLTNALCDYLEKNNTVVTIKQGDTDRETGVKTLFILDDIDFSGNGYTDKVINTEKLTNYLANKGFKYSHGGLTNNNMENKIIVQFDESVPNDTHGHHTKNNFSRSFDNEQDAKHAAKEYVEFPHPKPYIRTATVHEGGLITTPVAIVYTSMHTPDGIIVGQVEYNDFWKKWQLYVDGSHIGDYKLIAHALDDMRRSGFKGKFEKGGTTETQPKTLNLKPETTMYKIKSLLPQNATCLADGSLIYDTTTATKQCWQITSFTIDGINLTHQPISPLAQHEADKHITFDELLAMFNQNQIEVNGIAQSDARTLEVCIATAQKCIDLQIQQGEIEHICTQLSTTETALAEANQKIADLQAAEHARRERHQQKLAHANEDITLDKIAATARRIKTKKQAQEAIDAAHNFTTDDINASLGGLELQLADMPEGAEKTALSNYVDGLKVVAEEKQFGKGGMFSFLKRKKEKEPEYEYEILVTRSDGTKDNPIFQEENTAIDYKKAMEKIGHTAILNPIKKQFAKGGTVVDKHGAKIGKGDKVKTREGKIETVTGINSNGNIWTAENEYSWEPSSVELHEATGETSYYVVSDKKIPANYKPKDVYYVIDEKGHSNIKDALHAAEKSTNIYLKDIKKITEAEFNAGIEHHNTHYRIYAHGGGIDDVKKKWNKQIITEFLNSAGQNDVIFSVTDNDDTHLDGRSQGTYGLITFGVQSNTLYLEFETEKAAKMAFGELSNLLQPQYSIGSRFDIMPSTVMVQFVDDEPLYAKGGTTRSPILDLKWEKNNDGIKADYKHSTLNTSLPFGKNGFTVIFKGKPSIHVTYITDAIEAADKFAAQKDREPSPYELRMQKWDIEENVDCPNYKKTKEWSKKHGYTLADDVSYNGFIKIEKTICNGEYKLNLTVFDDTIKEALPRFRVDSWEADFGDTIMSETTYRFKDAHQGPFNIKNLNELFEVALRKEKELEKECEQYGKGGTIDGLPPEWQQKFDSLPEWHRRALNFSIKSVGLNVKDNLQAAQGAITALKLSTKVTNIIFDNAKTLREYTDWVYIPESMDELVELNPSLKGKDKHIIASAATTAFLHKKYPNVRDMWQAEPHFANLIKQNNIDINEFGKGGTLKVADKKLHIAKFWDGMYQVYGQDKINSKRFKFSTPAQANLFVADFKQSNSTNFFDVSIDKADKTKVIIRRRHSAFAGKKFEKGGNISFITLEKHIQKEYQGKQVTPKNTIC